MSDDFYAPHITDPDDPNEDGLTVTPEQFAKNAAKRHPELIDHSLDRPIKGVKPRRKALRRIEP
jgi:hypothetical protein